MKEWQPEGPEIQRARNFLRNFVLPAFKDQENISKGLGRRVDIVESKNGLRVSLAITNQWGLQELEITLQAEPTKNSRSILLKARTPKGKYEDYIDIDDYSNRETIRNMIAGYLHDSMENLVK